MLLNAGASVHARIKWNAATPLFCAVSGGLLGDSNCGGAADARKNSVSAGLLIAARADLGGKLSDGATLLHTAVGAPVGARNFAELLMAAGCDVCFEKGGCEVESYLDESGLENAGFYVLKSFQEASLHMSKLTV